MKDRPWIWLLVANIVFILGMSALVVTAIRHTPQEVPIHQEKHGDHGF